MLDIQENWAAIKKIFRNSFISSFHYAVATVNEEGEPHITPIGSLLLGKPGYGYYFEEFPKQLPLNIKNNEKICVLAVNSNRWFWVKSLIRGRFSSPPSVRLFGTAGKLREATQKEINLWHNRVKPVSFSKGHSMMWANMRMVRDVEFTRIEPVNIGEMTRYSWYKPLNKKHS
ncbi:MAG: pyridoxamine 5'-phosphate oxidase family protein [Chloroflexota bacterium]